MSDSGKKVFCILSSLLLCAGSQAITDDSANPYQGIVDRNVFGLKPPQIQAPADTKKTDLPPIILTGITTILGNKRVLMNVQAPGKPVQSFILTEGQRDGDIEVLEIDEKAGLVKVSQSGTIVPLTFEKNGAKLPASAPVPTNPGMPVAQLPGANANAFIPAVGAPAGMSAIPQRPMRESGIGSTRGEVGFSPGAASQGFGNAGIGSPGAFANNPAVTQGTNPSERPLSYDEGLLMIEAQHELAKSKGDPIADIMPPTELNPTRNTAEGRESEARAGMPQPSPVRKTPIGNPFPGFPQ